MNQILEMDKEKSVSDPLNSTLSLSEDIEIVVFIKKLWSGRKTIVLSTIAGGIIGIFVAILSTNIYISKSILVPQMNTDAKSSGLSGLAALAGINVGISQTSSEISPLIYPLIIKSIPFQLEMMKTPLQFNNSPKQVTYLEHLKAMESEFHLIPFIKKYTIGLPGLLLKALKFKKLESLLTEDKTGIVQLNEDEKKAKIELESIITIVFNVKEGYAILTAEMNEPIPAAQMAQKGVDLLQKYIIDFKIQKSKADMDFIQERFNEKKIEFENAQEQLALRIDRNKNFTSGLSNVETDRLQTKYTLTFGVYQELAKQLEQAKIQVKKETPVFSVIEPVTIPSEKSKPNRFVLLLLCIFLGGTFGIGIVLGKQYYFKIKSNWIEL